MFHPHCSLPSPHRVYNHLCAGVRSISAHHLLTCKNSKETTKTYQPLFIQCKEEKTRYYNVLKVYLLPLKKKNETTKCKPDANTDQQTCYHYDAGTIKNRNFVSSLCYPNSFPSLNIKVNKYYMLYIRQTHKTNQRVGKKLVSIF